MDARTNIGSRLPSRHGADGPEHVPAPPTSGPIHAAIAANRSDHRVVTHERGAEFSAAQIFKKTPYSADSKPAGRYVAQDIIDDAGIPFSPRMLGDHGCARGESAQANDSIVLNRELSERHANWRPRETTYGSEAIWNYARQTGTAVKGAVIHPGGAKRNSVMRIPRRVASLMVLGMALWAGPAWAFDGTATTQTGAPALPVVASPNAGAALQKAVPAAPAPTAASLSSLQYSADEGQTVAQFKLGRMYASGDGVVQDNLRAFDYFSKIANQHAEDNPAAPEAQIVANAFVALGRYYLEGIPDTRIKPDPERAREMFAYAASYFGNADAQYALARLYLDGVGTTRDPKYAARWLGLAAQKGQHQAQALLGQMLFNGEYFQRQAARGLMWLMLARDAATPNETWIYDTYNSAVKRATEDDRAMALKMLEQWVRGRHD
jgi:TPR repeat protein